MTTREYEAQVRQAQIGLYELIDPVADIFNKLQAQGIPPAAFLDAWIWFVATGTVNFTRSNKPEHQLDIDAGVDVALQRAMAHARETRPEKGETSQ